MEIDITKLPTFYINMKNEKERNRKTKQTLKDLGFKNVTRIPGVLGSKLDIRCMSGCKDCSFYRFSGTSAAFLNAFKKAKKINGPILILEDDIILSDNFKTVFTIPDNADAFYLGTSEGAIRPFTSDYMNREWMPPEFSDDLGNGIHKLYNMTSAHAIVYISDRFKNVVQECCRYTFQTGVPHDVYLTKFMKFYNIYISNHPTFWQDGLFKMTGNDLVDYNTPRQKESPGNN